MKKHKALKDRLLWVTDQILLIMNPLLAILNLIVAISILVGYYTPTKVYTIGASLCLSLMFLLLYVIDSYFRSNKII